MPAGDDIPLLLAVPALPFAGFLLNAAFGRRLGGRAAGLVACVAVGLSALLSFALALLLFAHPPAPGASHALTASLGDWIRAGSLRVGFDLALDPLSALMICVVTGVGFLIHLYSLGYMAEDASQPRYFAYLNLFVGMMLVLVLAGNLGLMFLGWEGVGLCSYLLIGFWFSDAAKAAAGLKAFLVNRIGDAGFLLAAAAAWHASGTLEIPGLSKASLGASLPLVCLGLLLGVCGKSAQIPLYTWLPDAMAGPTPVSALIHAATMVTAGVYLLCRTAGLYLACPFMMHAVAAVGLATALGAGLVACAQTDIKKVLAYSTVSQLGFMVLACGAGAFTGAMFHLVTHACFKACLFLCAGSVIHALGGEQDLSRMGGLRKAMPWTHAAFAASVLAICGVPPFSGFFSKDAILWGVLRGAGPAAWGLGLLAAGVTGYYMTRLYALAFHSSDRTSGHAHEAPWIMTGPVAALGALALLAGALDPHVPGMHLYSWLPGVLALPASAGAAPALPEAAAMAMAIAASVAGMGLAWSRFARAERVAPASALAAEGFGVDRFWRAALVDPLRRGAEALWFWVDCILIDGAMVEAPALVLRGVGQLARAAQRGKASASLACLLLGALLVLWLLGAAP